MEFILESFKVALLSMLSSSSSLSVEDETSIKEFVSELPNSLVFVEGCD